MQRARSSLEEREGGQRKVIRAMRYMWSLMDSPWFRPKRRQPSRLVVLRRSRRWKKGIGEVVEGEGRWGKSARTVGFVRGGVFVRMGGTLEVSTGFGSPVVILCCARGEDAGVGGGGRVCFLGFLDGHGGGGGGGGSGVCSWL